MTRKFDPIATLNITAADMRDKGLRLSSNNLDKVMATISETIVSTVEKNPACCTVSVWVPYVHLALAVKSLDSKGFTVVLPPASPLTGTDPKASADDDSPFSMRYGTAITINW